MGNGGFWVRYTNMHVLYIFVGGSTLKKGPAVVCFTLQAINITRLRLVTFDGLVCLVFSLSLLFTVKWTILFYFILFRP